MLIKLVMNVFATVILLLYMQTLNYLADLAEETRTGDISELRNPSPALHAFAAILLLVVAATLSVYKPRGMSRYGQRKQNERSMSVPTQEPALSQT